jgi:hypothetical protein
MFCAAVNMTISSLELLPANALFVRGYNTSGVTISFILSNLDSIVDIANLAFNNSRRNFVVGSFLTGSNVNTFNVSVNSSSPLITAFTNNSMAQQGIAVLSNMSVSIFFPANILVPRQPCAQRKWLCVYVVPGTLASYNLTTDVINCVDLTFYVNCLGL